LIKKIIFLLFCFQSIYVSTNAQTAYHIPIFDTKKITEKNYSTFKSDSSHKSTGGFCLGASLGFYFANKNTAQYYNGASVNSIDSVINYPYNYYAIKEKLNYDFVLAELPAKMKYNPSLLLGIYARYSIKNFGFFMNFNMAKLKTKDVFTIQVLDSGNTLSQKIYRQEVLTGSEQRSNIDLGITYAIPSKGKSKPYFELGCNISDTKYIDNKINIEGLDYSLTNYYYTYNKIEQGGIGMGIFGGAGIELNFNDYLTLDPGFNLYYTKIKLGNFNEFKLNSSVYVRLILNGLL
jgi:hypothetical protein